MRAFGAIIYGKGSRPNALSTLIHAHPVKGSRSSRDCLFGQAGGACVTSRLLDGCPSMPAACEATDPCCQGIKPLFVTTPDRLEVGTNGLRHTLPVFTNTGSRQRQLQDGALSRCSTLSGEIHPPSFLSSPQRPYSVAPTPRFRGVSGDTLVRPCPPWPACGIRLAASHSPATLHP